MKIVKVQQNSKEWLSWRGKGLGASNAPTIMGVSPWCSPFELWLEMLGMKNRPPAAEFAVRAMVRGTNLEPEARRLFEKEQGVAYPALSASHDDYEYIRASFDGYNAERNEILEIKCPGKADHDKARAGKVPEKYFPQLQQQFLVSGATKGWYVSWDGKGSLVSIPVLRDDDYIHGTNQTEDADGNGATEGSEGLLYKLIEFWDCVQKRRSPDVSQKDIAKLLEEQKDLLQQAEKINSVLGLLT